MKFAFSCPKCGKRLRADLALAGRIGRCRGCGHGIVVPDGPRSAGDGRAAVSHRAASRDRLGADQEPLPDWRTAVSRQLVAAPRPPGPTSARAEPRPGRVDARPAADVSSGYSLRPVTPQGVPALSLPDWAAAEIGDPVDVPAGDDGDFTPTTAPVVQAEPSRTPSQLLVAYRWLFGQLAGVSTWISETSYTISFIVIILAIASGMIGRHELAQWGTAAVVVLNLLGLVGDLASLVTLSFRRSPIQGALFLVPPFTLFYLWCDWDRYRDAVGRMRIPLVTLAFVVAAYLFVPWLRGGKDGDGVIAAAVERVIGEIEKDFGRPRGSVDDVLDRARSWLREPTPSGAASRPVSRAAAGPAAAGGP